MMVLTIVACAVAFAVLNRLRGTKNYLVWAGAAVLGAIVWWLSRDWVAAAIVAGAFVLGENFGWTKWINCIPGHLTQKQYNAKWLVDDTGKSDGSYWLAQAAVDERQDYWWHCFVGMTLRGVYWWAPVFAALWWFGLVGGLVAVVAVAGLALVFPLIYRFAYGIKVGEYGYLQRAEVIYGAVYGVVLGAALVV